MSLLAATMLLFAAEAPVMIVSAPEAEYDIGYDELLAGEDRAALEAIENCKNLPADDPARQINHGIALARLGDYGEARERFDAASRNAERYELQTSTGDWIDSKVIARRGLAMLDQGEFRGYEALAVR